MRSTRSSDVLFQEILNWPADKPNVPPKMSQGWFSGLNQAILSPTLSDQTKMVIEVGSWMGKSTRWISDQAPNAIVIAIDTWLGAVELISDEQHRKFLPTLYETFLVNCWDYRTKIFPLRADSITGLRVCKKHGIQPDMIFVDGSHEYRSVLGDMLTILEEFPSSIITGDDYWNAGVRNAVHDALAQFDPKSYTFNSNKRAFCVRPQPTVIELDTSKKKKIAEEAKHDVDVAAEEEAGAIVTYPVPGPHRVSLEDRDTVTPIPLRGKHWA